MECPTGLILASTRSNKDADARRNFVDFDVNEELCRARSALREIDKGEYAERAPDALQAFVAECFLNIDEWLSRGGDLPSAWQGRFPFAGAMPPPPGSTREAWSRAVVLAKTVVLPEKVTPDPECACDDRATS